MSQSSSTDSPSYPWFDFKPDGDVHFSGIPERLQRHPEVRRRGLTFVEVMKPGTVFATLRYEKPARVVKILDTRSEELAIYQRLLREPKRPNNHTIPCEITLDGHPLLFMPLADDLGIFDAVWDRRSSRSSLADIIYQLIEGIEFLHGMHIAHMDLSDTNVLAAAPSYAAANAQLVLNRLYIIDFGASLQLPLGPGVQCAITLPGTQVQPPNGLTHFDPYSWDIYCAGRTLERVVKIRFQDAQERPHALVQKYVQWLIGDERGCTGVCHCRPTARTALKVALVLRWAFNAPEGYEWVVDILPYLW